MSQLTILGLGPGEWKHLTLEAVEVLNNHQEIWLRTRHHPLVAQMPSHLTVHSFDKWYEEADDFQKNAFAGLPAPHLNKSIVDR